MCFVLSVLEINDLPLKNNLTLGRNKKRNIRSFTGSDIGVDRNKLKKSKDPNTSAVRAETVRSFSIEAEVLSLIVNTLSHTVS